MRATPVMAGQTDTRNKYTQQSLEITDEKKDLKIWAILALNSTQQKGMQPSAPHRHAIQISCFPRPRSNWGGGSHKTTTSLSYIHLRVNVAPWRVQPYATGENADRQTYGKMHRIPSGPRSCISIAANDDRDVGGSILRQECCPEWSNQTLPQAVGWILWWVIHDVAGHLFRGGREGRRVGLAREAGRCTRNKRTW